MNVVAETVVDGDRRDIARGHRSEQGLVAVARRADRLEPAAAAGGVTAAIDRMFENSDAPTKTMTEKQFQAQFMEMMGNIKGLIRWISLVILFAVTLIVANTVAMSARERVTAMPTLGSRLKRRLRSAASFSSRTVTW